MLDFKIKKDSEGVAYLETSISGKALLTIPQLNKGTAFTIEERDAFHLTGKLPPVVQTLEEQIQRAYLQYKSFDKQLNRNIQLHHLLNTNHILFYSLVKKYIEEMLPTIYTPIVGNAVQIFNKKFLHPRGIYISFEDQDRIEMILDNRSNPDIDLIVTSDGEGVLGIGDQGVGAMEIPVAKLMLYTAFGGISPLNTLPILLDAGTNNQTLLDDPLYLGWRHKRISGEKYDIFIDKFIRAVKTKFPHVFLHWEDFGRHNAYRNLVHYREKICSFNDDLQGTGVVTLAALLAAMRLTEDTLESQRIVIFGAGTAGIGVTENILKALTRKKIPEAEARKRFWLIDQPGLLTKHVSTMTEAQTPFARTDEDIKNWNISDPNHITLLEVIENLKPTILIGCSAQPGAFTKEVVTTMAKHTKNPIIFPLSNPTEKSEATPKDILEWTEGTAFIATGSPFDPVDYKGKKFPITQCNNYLSFPGIGLGIVASKAYRLSDNMLLAATKAKS